MSQNNSNDKAAMLAKIEGINEVEGFDPTPFAVDYTDLETGEVRKRLPVMIQMAWFRTGPDKCVHPSALQPSFFSVLETHRNLRFSTLSRRICRP